MELLKLRVGWGPLCLLQSPQNKRGEDKDFTAQFYYDRWLQVKCIEAWKIYTSNPKVDNDDDSIALESHTNTLLSVGLDDSRFKNGPSIIVLDDDALPVNPRATLSLKSPSPQSYRAKAQRNKRSGGGKVSQIQEKAKTQNERKEEESFVTWPSWSHESR